MQLTNTEILLTIPSYDGFGARNECLVFKLRLGHIQLAALRVFHKLVERRKEVFFGMKRLVADTNVSSWHGNQANAHAISSFYLGGLIEHAEEGLCSLPQREKYLGR